MRILARHFLNQDRGESPECGTVARPRKSLETNLSLSALIRLYPRNSSAVLLELVKKVCCDHDALGRYIEASLDVGKARFRSIEIEGHSGETIALPTESRFILSMEWQGASI